MVVGAFPAIKLAVLLFKQISKPIANIAKERAKNNRFFRTYICMPPAQFYNWCEVKSKMWIMNLGKPVSVPPLNEQMAIELGANMLGEGIIFILGAAVLILEYNRSANKEAAKEKQRVDEMNKLIDTVNELYFSSQMQETKIREMERMIGDLESEVFHKPRPLDPTPPPPGHTEPPLELLELPKELEDIINTESDKEKNDKPKPSKDSHPVPKPGDTTRVVTKPWTGKQKPDSDGAPPPPGAIHAPLEQLKVPEILEDNPKKTKPKKEKEDNESNPFPDKNLVMKSLNYVELDVRSAPAPAKVELPVTSPVFERKPNFLMDALSYLENDVKGLLT